MRRRWPAAEVAVHPSDDAVHHEPSLMCDDVHASKAELEATGIEFRGEPKDMGLRRRRRDDVARRRRVLLYEPRHAPAIDR